MDMTMKITGKRRGRKRKSETPITVPTNIGDMNMHITNTSPEYCSQPEVFGDFMIFSKKNEPEAVPPPLPPAPTTTPLLPLLQPVVDIPSTTTTTALPRVKKRKISITTKSGLGTNVNLLETKQVGVPPSSDASCWWCCHEFEWGPLSLPYFHDEKRNRFKVSGNFCSWNCVKAFNNSLNSVNKYRQQGYIHSLFRLVNQQPVHKSIPLAPSRWSLKKFGGTLTIEQFRQNCVLLDSEGSKRLERNTILCVQPITPTNFADFTL
jgi:hypothetical protein